MEVGDKIKIVLLNQYQFSGKILSFDDETIKILDKFGHEVSITRKNIMFQEIF